MAFSAVLCMMMILSQESVALLHAAVGALARGRNGRGKCAYKEVDLHREDQCGCNTRQNTYKTG